MEIPTTLFYSKACKTILKTYSVKDLTVNSKSLGRKNVGSVVQKFSFDVKYSQIGFCYMRKWGVVLSAVMDLLIFASSNH